MFSRYLLALPSLEKALSLFRFSILLVALVFSLQIDNGLLLAVSLLTYVLIQLLLLKTKLAVDWRTLFGLFLDLALLTYLIYAFDGVLSGWVSLLLIPALIGALTLPSMMTVSVSLLSIISYSALLQSYLSGAQEHAHHMHTSMSEHLFGMLATFVVSVCLLTFFISRQMSIIRSQQKRITLLHDRQWRQRQIMSMATYSANSAHKIATPLASCKLLLEELADELEHAKADKLALLQTAQKQLATCEQALDQMRKKASQSDFTHISQTNTFDWLQALLQEWWNGHNEIQLEIALESELKSQLISVNDNLKFALFNLLDNAANAAIQKADLRILFEAGLSSTQLNIRLQDYGEGVSADKLSMLGKQAQISEQGMGIGLLLTSESIAELSGTMDIQSSPDGTCVIIRLPLQDKETI